MLKKWGRPLLIPGLAIGLSGCSAAATAPTSFPHERRLDVFDTRNRDASTDGMMRQDRERLGGQDYARLVRFRMQRRRAQAPARCRQRECLSPTVHRAAARELGERSGTNQNKKTVRDGPAKPKRAQP